MLSECELIDTVNISLLSQYVKFFGEWTSYSLEQADIFQYQTYEYSDDMLIIRTSSINMDIWYINFIGFNICIFAGKIT